MNEHISTDLTTMGRHITAECTPYFYDQRAAVSLLRARRWKHGLYCPRCGSLNVREVNTTRVIEALSCRECRYNFTSGANTVFHASLLPLQVKFQMVTAYQLEPSISVLRMARVFEINVKTAERLIAVLRAFPFNGFGYKTDEYLPFESFPSVTAYLEQSGVVFVQSLFEELLDLLLEPAGRPMRRPGFISS